MLHSHTQQVIFHSSKQITILTFLYLLPAYQFPQAPPGSYGTYPGNYAHQIQQQGYPHPQGYPQQMQQQQQPDPNKPFGW